MGHDPLFDAPVVAPQAQEDPLVAAAVDDLADVAQPTEWIVYGMVAAGSEGIWAGQPKAAKKSLLVGHLANCVARGVPFFGRPTKRMPVLYCDMEQGARTMALRWRRLGRGRVSGYTNEFDRGLFRTYFGLEGWFKVLEIIANSQVFVVLDPLANILAQLGIDENSPAQMTKFFADLRPILQRSGSVLICIHHFRKSPVGRKEIDADMMRGSGSLQGIVDGWWLSGPKSRRDPNTVLVEWTNRDAPSGSMCVSVALDETIDPPFGRFIFAEEELEEETDTPQKLSRQSTSQRVRVIEALRQASGSLSTQAIGKRAGMAWATAAKTLDRLIEDGFVEGDKTAWRLTAQFHAAEAKAAEVLSSKSKDPN